MEIFGQASTNKSKEEEKAAKKETSSMKPKAR
jgi:hypothetical protein